MKAQTWRALHVTFALPTLSAAALLKWRFDGDFCCAHVLTRHNVALC